MDAIATQEELDDLQTQIYIVAGALGGVCFLLCLISIYLIVRSAKTNKRLKDLEILVNVTAGNEYRDNRAMYNHSTYGSRKADFQRQTSGPFNSGASVKSFAYDAGTNTGGFDKTNGVRVLPTDAPRRSNPGSLNNKPKLYY